MLTASLFRNREFKLYLLAVIAAVLLFSLVSQYFLLRLWADARDDELKLRFSAMGHLLAEHPELESTMVRALLAEPTEESLQLGMTHAAAYGYTLDQPLGFSSAFHSKYIRSSLALQVICVFELIALIILTWLTFRYIYRKINQISLGTDEIMRGRFDTRFPEEAEGDLAILGLQFNQMSKRLQLTMEQLIEEKERLRNLIFDISHQLKTPLSSLRMFNELLLDGKVEDPGKAREFLERSRSQLERMEWLIGTLLKISRLETGVYQLQCRMVDLRPAVEEVVQSLTLRSREKAQTLRLALPSHSVPIPYDNKWLREALENIIKNAIDYTPSGGNVEVRMQETTMKVMIQVKDTGTGIAEKDLPHIFERFYQGEHTRGMASGGSGIGLALARLIVEKHEGVIHVESVPGEGATFIISLPRIEEASRSEVMMGNRPKFS